MIDPFFAKVYHDRDYNCAHLVCEVWSLLRGPELGEVLRGYLCASYERKVILADMRRVKLLEQPEDPCIVWMKALRTPAHVGVWYKGKVLHITRRGVHYQPLEVASIGFNRIRFFTC